MWRYLEGVHAEAVDVAEGGWNTAAAEEMHEGVDAFGIVVVVIPKHVCVLWRKQVSCLDLPLPHFQRTSTKRPTWYISLRMTLMRSVHRRKLDRIPNEEHRKVIPYEVVVAFFCEELER